MFLLPFLSATVYARTSENQSCGLPINSFTFGESCGHSLDFIEPCSENTPSIYHYYAARRGPSINGFITFDAFDIDISFCAINALYELAIRNLIMLLL